MVKAYLPLCPLHYHQCVSGKTQSVELKNNFGSASYNADTHSMVYPSTVPKERLPIPKGDLKTVKRKGLVANFRLPTFSAKISIPIGYDADIDDLDTDTISHQTGENRTVESQAETTLPSTRQDAGESALDLDPSDSYGAQWDRGKGTPALPLQNEVGPVRNFIEQGESIEADYFGKTRSSTMKGMRVSLSNPNITNNIFYVDSGAGQFLSSCSTVFMTLEPCTLEVVGVAGSLPIFGRGTAVFVLTLPDDDAVLVRIYNCLYSFGEFNLLSVSQMQTIKSNTLDLSLVSHGVRLYGEPAPLDQSVGKPYRKYVDVPFPIDDG